MAFLYRLGCDGRAARPDTFNTLSRMGVGSPATYFCFISRDDGWTREVFSTNLYVVRGNNYYPSVRSVFVISFHYVAVDVTRSCFAQIWRGLNL